MSLRRHLQTIALVERIPAILYRVRRYFSLPCAPLALCLRRAALGQADLVLCLLKIGTGTARRFVERLIGKPITRAVAPPREPCVYLSTPVQRVVRVLPNPCRLSTRFHCNYELFRVGRTVEQLLARGVTRREIRLARRRGWIQFA